jgi:polyisoprenoid-binding protein YceI
MFNAANSHEVSGDPMTHHRWALTIVLCGMAAVAIAHGAPERSYAIDSSRSSATIEVGKAGALSFAAGHTHEVVASGITGTLTVDTGDPARSAGRVVIDASALNVSSKGEPADDVPKVQATMSGPQVLDVQHYPTITFSTTSIVIKSNQGATLDAIVTGQLSLHNVTRSITVPVAARMEGQTLIATGRFPIKQSDYGMKPVSVGGVVSVKDTVNVSFTIVGH